MPDTTGLGFVFPEATDDVNLWEHFEALAVSINDYIASHGRVATAVVDTDSPTFTTSEASLGALVAPLVSGRTYKVRMILHIGTTVANDWVTLRLCETNLAGTQLHSIDNAPLPSTTAAGHYFAIEGEYTAVATGNKTFVVGGVRASGTGTLRREAAAIRPTIFYVDYVRG